MNEEFLVYFLTWCFWFFIYAFIGWCFESTYCSIKERRLINRGFLKMPFLPIYGFGAMIFITATYRLQVDFSSIPGAVGSILLIFLVCSISATIFELIVGILMEAIFKVRYWDYTHTKYNFKGYICLGSSITWGILGVLMNLFIHPFLEERLVNWLPEEIYGRITCILIGAIIFDFIMSTKAAFELINTIKYLENAYDNAEKMLERLHVAAEDTKEDIDRKLFEFKQSMTESVQDIIKRNPSLSCKEHIESLSKIKDMLIRRAQMILDARAAFR